MEYTQEGFVVTEDIHGAHPTLPYPLYVGDLLVHMDDGTWRKEAPGVCVGNFKLTIDQEASLKRVKFANDGLTFAIDPNS